MSANKKPIVCVNNVDLIRQVLTEFGRKEQGDILWKAHCELATAMNELRNILGITSGNLMDKDQGIQNGYEMYCGAFDVFCTVFDETVGMINIALPESAEEGVPNA